MEIGNVKLGYLREVIKTGIIENGQTVYHILREDVGEKLCIIDKKYAIDINDFNNRYEIIQRDDHHRIISNFNSDDIYALNVEPIELENQKEYKTKIKHYKRSVK